MTVRFQLKNVRTPFAVFRWFGLPPAFFKASHLLAMPQKELRSHGIRFLVIFRDPSLAGLIHFLLALLLGSVKIARSFRFIVMFVRRIELLVFLEMSVEMFQSVSVDFIKCKQRSSGKKLFAQRRTLFILERGEDWRWFTRERDVWARGVEIGFLA